MKIVGFNRFNDKKGNSWLVLYGVQKFSFPEGKKGYETTSHWFKNPDPAVIDKCELGIDVEVLYKKDGNNSRAFDVVPSEDNIEFEF